MKCIWMQIAGNFFATLVVAFFLALPPAAADVLTDKASAEAQFKFDILKNFVRSMENQVLSLASSDFTRRYADGYNEADRRHVATLFHAVATANTDYMQVRLLDMFGRERVRIDRAKGLANPRIVSDDQLQDKGGKSYYLGPKSLSEGEAWHSNVNLNMEQGKIEMPIRPTFRVSAPVHVDGRFQGVVVVNLMMNRLLSLVGHSADFKVFMVDRDDEFIMHPDPTKAWSRYLPGRDRYSELFSDVFRPYTYPLNDVFRNQDEANLVLVPKETLLEGLGLGGGTPVSIALTSEEKAWITANPTIRSIALADWPPVDFRRADGMHTGIAADILKLVASRVGLKIEPRFGPWGELLSALKEGQIDLAPDIFHTKDRAKVLSYTRPYLSLYDAIFIGPTGQGIKTVADLYGKTVAVENGYSIKSILETDHPEINLVVVDTSLEALQKVSIGEVNAYVGTQHVTSHLIETNLLKDIRAVALFSDKPQLVYMAVPNDRKILHSIIDKGLASVSELERREITKRYIGETDDEKIRASLQLTDKEWGWLAAHPVIRFAAMKNWPPFVFFDADEQVKGISVDIATTLEKMLRVKFLPTKDWGWDNPVEGVSVGNVDTLIAIEETQEHARKVRFTKPYLTAPVVIVTRDSEKGISAIDDLDGKSIGVMSAQGVMHQIRRRFPNYNLVLQDNIVDGLHAVSAGELDVFVGNLQTVSYSIANYGLANLKVAATTPYVQRISMVAAHNQEVLHSILNKSLAALSDAQKTEIVERWVKTDYELGIDIMTILRWALPMAGGVVLLITVITLWNRRMAREIDERIKAQTQLAEAEERARLLLESVGEGVFGVDTNGKVTFANPMATHLLGFPLEKFLGASSHDLIHHHHRDGAVHPVADCSMYKSLKDGNAYRVDDEVFWREDGTCFEVEYHSTPIRKNGDVIGAVLAFSDISSRKDAERRLAESEESTRRILESVGEGVFGVDTSGVIDFVNPQCVNLLGYAEEEMLGSRAHPLFHHHRADGSHYPVQECWMYKSFTIGDSYRIDDEVLWRKDGSPMEVEYSSTPIVEDGELVGAVISFIDISLRKKAERELNDAFDVIRDSIKYATHIQQSILPDEGCFADVTSDSFILWEPRDRVGGDLYWCKPWGLGKLVALGDCTGHGVPGAFMTMIANGAIEMATLETMPGDVGALLQRVHQLVQETLGQHLGEGESDDGLDLGVCYLRPDTKTFSFSGARFSLFRIDGTEIEEIKGDRSGIGYRGGHASVSFTNQDIEAGEHSSFYMASDGLVDQVGGPRRRSFGKRRLKDLLLQLSLLPMSENEDAIRQALQEYQGKEKRRDDVSVMGFRL